ncbi:DUF6734 family protein [Flavobacterium adhaerens]|uniref:DUF6734 family protein n=1 Tax=Flavobacterium adhaerens TaxID=3149043 RepID=UPI0032B57924
MKIIQSFWSGGRKDILEDSFGWVSPKYHLMGWALSVHLLSKHYKVELYTDKVGYELLINKLKLPYAKVHVVMDDLNKYDKNLWALAKIYVYSLQDTPFLHIDGDVFIWEKFSKELLNGRLIAQNLESSTLYYESNMKDLEKHLPYFPDEIIKDRENIKTIYASNAGILGGSDIVFFKDYTKKAFEFVDRNYEHLNKISAWNFNIFFEQYLFYCLAKSIKIEYLFPEIIEDNGYKGFGNFEDVPHTRTFLHLLGTFKTDLTTCEKMALVLLNEFPNTYLNVLEVFGNKEAQFYSDKLVGKTFDNINFASYFRSEPLLNRFYKTGKLMRQIHQIQKKESNLPAIFGSMETIEDEVVLLKNPELEKTYELEKNICNYLSSLDQVDIDILMERNLSLIPKFSSFFNNAIDFNSICVKAEPVAKILNAPYLYSDDFNLFEEEPADKELSRLIIANIGSPYYSEIIIDDLEEVILEELFNKKI